MRKALRVLGIISLLLIVIAIVGFAILAKEGAALDSESRNYADSSIIAIVGDWDQNELQKRATSGFLVNAPPADIDRLFAKLRTLGRMKTYNGSRGQARMMINQGGKNVTANYEATADFDTGPARITLNLVKGIDGWRIHGFYVFSKALL
jgi:hypothetical protein